MDRSTAKSSALIDDLKQEMDHKLAGVRDELKKLIGKLEGREDASEGRLSEIEKKVADSIKGALQCISSLRFVQRNVSIPCFGFYRREGFINLLQCECYCWGIFALL